MVNLLVQFRTKIDWSNYADWTYDEDSWLFNEDASGIQILSKISGSGTTIKKSLFDIGKRYRITFSVVNNVNNYTGGRFRIKYNNTYSQYFQTNGDYEVITSAITNREFSIISEFTYSGYGIKDLFIEEIGYSKLDLPTDTDIALNFSVADVRNYEQRNGTYSKTITVPGTARNNNFFHHIFNINQDNRFNINYKCPATIQLSDTSFIDGNIQLDEIIKNREVISYNIVFYGNNLNLFHDVAEDKIEDLDCPELDHIANISNITSSWDNPTPYTYPLINYGKDSKGALYGTVGSALDASPSVGLTVNDLYPAVNVKYLIDKIFDTYGYSYSSSIFESDDFAKLILPFTNNEEDLEQEYLVADINFGGENCLGPFFGQDFNWDWTTNSGGTYNTGVYMNAYNDGIPSYYISSNSNGVYTVANRDTYRRFNCGPYSLSYRTPLQTLIGTANQDNPDGYQSVHNHIPGTYQCRKAGTHKIIVKYKITEYDPQGNAFIGVIPTRFNPNDVEIGPYNPYNQEFTWRIAEGKEYTYDIDSIYSTGSFTSTYTFENCEEGDLIGLKYIGQNMNSWAGDIINIKVYETGWGENCEVEQKMILPKDFAIKDFLKNLISMYNLYIDVDPEDNSKLIIEPRDTYYASGSTYDWSRKLDISQDISFIPPREFQSYFNNLRYTQAEDYWNLRYNDQKDIRKVGYGGKQRIIESDFNTGTNDLEITFEPTLIIDEWTKKGYTDNTQFITSSMLNATYPVEQYLLPEFKTNWGHRILIFNKTNIFDNQYPNPADATKFKLARNDYDYYPYAGHISEPFNLTGSTCFDINFETPKNIGNTWTKMFGGYPNDRMTDNNLFNTYYRNYFYEISDKDSRIMTAYFKLDSQDIAKLNLNDTILVNGTYFTINNIIDYNPNGKTLTKVELFKKSDNPIPALIPDAELDDDTPIKPRPPIPVRPTINLGTSNSSLGSNVIILGTGNTIKGNNSFVSGNYISVNKSSTVLSSEYINSQEETTILNSKNINISSGATDVTVIGAKSLNIGPNDANTVYIDSIKVKDGIIVATSGIIDCGHIEIDGVYNPYKRKDYMITDSGENGTGIDDIDAWINVDGGSIG